MNFVKDSSLKFFSGEMILYRENISVIVLYLKSSCKY